MHSVRWKTDIKLILVYKLSLQCCFIFSVLDSSNLCLYWLFFSTLIPWILFSLSWSPSAPWDSSCWSGWGLRVHNATGTGFPTSVQVCQHTYCRDLIPLFALLLVLGLHSFSFFFFLKTCNSNYFKHNYILQHFESTKCCAQHLNSQLIPSEAKCQQAFEEALDCPRQLSEEQCITAATTLTWHRAQVLLRGVSPVEWSR